ncbi:hypothetical protein, partial [Xanthomonas hortorum]|uniref:hypothetical protein n=1 Tax=Xanthomonas hortorum TaxID=56454 RepID=UPI002FE3C1CF
LILGGGSWPVVLPAHIGVYGWNLPVAMAAGTPLAALWAIAVSVRKDPATGVLYLATGSTTYPVATILEGIVDAQVLSGGTHPLPPAPITHRSAAPRRTTHEQATVAQGRRRGRR